MRSRFFPSLLSAVVTLAACGDDKDALQLTGNQRSDLEQYLLSL